MIPAHDPLNEKCNRNTKKGVPCTMAQHQHGECDFLKCSCPQDREQADKDNAEAMRKIMR